MSVHNEGRRAVALTTGPASSDVPTDKAGRRKNKTALRQAAKALAPEGSRVNADLAEGGSDAESPLRRDDADNQGEAYFATSTNRGRTEEFGASRLVDSMIHGHLEGKTRQAEEPQSGGNSGLNSPLEDATIRATTVEVRNQVAISLKTLSELTPAAVAPWLISLEQAESSRLTYRIEALITPALKHSLGVLIPRDAQFRKLVAPEGPDTEEGFNKTEANWLTAPQIEIARAIGRLIQKDNKAGGASRSPLEAIEQIKYGFKPSDAYCATKYLTDVQRLRQYCHTFGEWYQSKIAPVHFIKVLSSFIK